MARKPKNIADNIFLEPEVKAQIKAGIHQNCHERRHMGAAEFMTYNAMYAASQPGRTQNDGKLIFKGGDYWLANANNRSVNSERSALVVLKATKWIELVRKKIGGTNWYRLIEHEEYIKMFPNSCPPMKYMDRLMADLTGQPSHTPVGREAALVPLAFMPEGDSDEDINEALAGSDESIFSRTIGEAMNNLSDEDRSAIARHLKRALPENW